MSRSSSAIRSSIRAAHRHERRDQSRRFGTRFGRQLVELGRDLVDREPDARRGPRSRPSPTATPSTTTSRWIPTPGHTPGATAYLRSRGGHRFLLTGSATASGCPASSTRATGVRELDFDVLVPSASSADEPPYAETDREDARRRIDAILTRLGDRAPRLTRCACGTAEVQRR